ncbi:hypothetical protein [Streptosporangium carneum]|uniref:Uncharacterized protein n=1 Tax=Streptosporangium carneum TaxID=47481 RepID=A0A9W6I5V3_9ACTN|nr:hypothetical protein [Streptosporangium carneum]GLK11510.1 hypothetical protein GCM10017600_49170 [Streptosporangium carneum]
METVLNLLLIRFGVIVGALVVLALILFAVAVALKRRGGIDRARRYAEPVARAVARRLADRDTARPGRGASRGGLAGDVVRAVARHLDDDRRGNGDR